MRLHLNPSPAPTKPSQTRKKCPWPLMNSFLFVKHLFIYLSLSFFSSFLKLFFKIAIHLFCVCMSAWCVCLCVCTHIVPQSLCALRTTFMVSLSQVGPKDWTQVVRLGDKCLYLPSHLTSPIWELFTEKTGPRWMTFKVPANDLDQDAVIIVYVFFPLH